VVFLVDEATHMAHHERVFRQAQLDAQRFARGLVARPHLERRQVNRVVQHLITGRLVPVQAVESFCRAGAAREAVRGIPAHQPLSQVQVDGPLQVAVRLPVIARVVVAVGDAHGHPGPRRLPQHPAAVMVHVAVDHVIRTVLFYDLLEIARIQQRFLRIETRDDPGAKRANLLVERRGFGRVHQKVHVISVVVDVAQHVHQPDFDSAPVHGAQDMQHANRALLDLRRLAGQAGRRFVGVCLRPERIQHNQHAADQLRGAGDDQHETRPAQPMRGDQQHADQGRDDRDDAEQDRLDAKLAGRRHAPPCKRRHVA